MDTSTLRHQDINHVWHPFTPMQEYATEETPIIVSGDGFELIDSDGQRYLDGISALWCNVHGFRVPAIDDAIRDQLDRVGHSTLLGLSNEPAIRLAKELVDRTPEGLNRVFYSDSGATSVEAALKIAYQYHAQKPGGPERRDLFISVAGAYHGDTIGSVSLGAMNLFHATYRDLLFNKLTVPSPVAFRLPVGHSRESYLEHCFAELERTIVENHARVAAFVIEPLVQGAAGILVHPPGYLKRVRELTADYDIPLIADEVAVGFGRTGTMFACEQENVTPDLMCLAKGLTGGYLPVAATLATDAIFEAFLDVPWAGKTFYHGHTFTGNPLGCAAALASLDLFDTNDVLGNIRSNATRLSTRLTGFAARCSSVGEIRHKGIMAGIELVKDAESLEPFTADRRIGHKVTLAARCRGVIVRPLGDTIVLMPAPAMPGELVERLCDNVFDAIENVLSEER
ncbi:adenosylmethionine--8-amino-7-oxononanoate transaminase [bacterium]|nr:adenosylmethionine--8-amino-7-oxononanoate transaminase [bacterium]